MTSYTFAPPARPGSLPRSSLGSWTCLWWVLYHTELGAYAGLRSGDARLRAGMDMALAALYSQCEIVLSPSECGRRLGAGARGRRRSGSGAGSEVSTLSRFNPALREPGSLPGELNVLYAGRLTTEKGVGLLADAFLVARAADPRLHLVLAGGGPEEAALRERLGAHATFLGWLEGDELARAYASADIFLFASRTDTFGQVVLEAQASGLPVVAVAEGGPLSLIEDGRTGRLCTPEAEPLAAAVLELARFPALRRRLAGEALTSVNERSWEQALGQLAAGYRRALDERALSGGAGRRTAA